MSMTMFLNQLFYCSLYITKDSLARAAKLHALSPELGYLLSLKPHEKWVLSR